MKLNLFKLLILISISFLAYYLYDNEMFVVPHIYSITKLAISLVFLFIGFVFQALNWHQILKFQHPIKFSDSISSVGLSIFTKYIPGKIMTIIGKAQYIKNKYNYPLRALLNQSLNAQIIVIWSGLIVGSLGLILTNSKIEWFVYVLLAISLLTIFIFTPFLHKIVKGFVKFAFKKNIKLQFTEPKLILRILPVFFLYWFFFSAAFFFLAESLSKDTLSIWIGLYFPMASTLGIALLFAPGGIGVREGIITFLLHLSGIDIITAASISITSRLWFLSGESFIFLLGLLCNLQKTQ